MATIFKKVGDMLRAHARQIIMGKWLSTVCTRAVTVVYFRYNPCTRTPSNTVRLLVSYFYADDIMGVAYLKKHTPDSESSRQINEHPKKDVN